MKSISFLLIFFDFYDFVFRFFCVLMFFTDVWGCVGAIWMWVALMRGHHPRRHRTRSPVRLLLLSGSVA
jgi:hypothetical protein